MQIKALPLLLALATTAIATFSAYAGLGQRGENSVYAREPQPDDYLDLLYSREHQIDDYYDREAESDVDHIALQVREEIMDFVRRKVDAGMCSSCTTGCKNAGEFNPQYPSCIQDCNKRGYCKGATI